MSWLDDVREWLTKTAQTIVDFVNEINAWAESPQGKEVTKIVIEAVTIIVRIIDLFGSEVPTSSGKRESARAGMRILISAPPGAIERLAEIKATGQLDGLTDAQLDALLGGVTAKHVADSKRKKTGKDGRKPT